MKFKVGDVLIYQDGLFPKERNTITKVSSDIYYYYVNNHGDREFSAPISGMEKVMELDIILMSEKLFNKDLKDLLNE